MEMEHPLWHGWVTLSLIALMFAALLLDIAPPHLVMMLTVTLFIPLKILSLDRALRGFSDDAVLSVAVLFVVAKGIEQTGGLEYISKLVLRTKGYDEEITSGKKKSRCSMAWMLLQFTLPLAMVSAFVDNIPLVAIMIPLTVELSRKVGFASSKMLMPLSYAAQVGGTITLIGTSTNLVVASLVAKQIPQMRIHLFEIGIIDVPVTVCGILYMIALSGKLLPNNLSIQANSTNAREYNVILIVKAKSSLSNKSVKKSGLKHLPGLKLVQIVREGELTGSPDSDFIIHPKDQLHFSGVIDSILFLTQIDGLALPDYEDQGQLSGFAPLQRQKAIIATSIVLGMIIATTVGVNLTTAALLSAAALLITKCLTPSEAMDSLDLSVIVMIAAAFGISEAMVESGAAKMVSKVFMGLAGTSKFGLITCTYIATTMFSLVISNNAAVTIMFPVALAASRSRDMDFRPFSYILMMAASSGLMTPIGCPTNLMVYEPGCYKFWDYVRYGGPLQILLLTVTVGLILTLKWWWLWWIVLIFFAIISIPFFAKLPWNQINNSQACEDERSGARKNDRKHGDEEMGAIYIQRDVASSTSMTLSNATAN